MNHERIFVAWVSDRPGVLTRIASVFFRRSINIMSLNVASTQLPEVSKMVIRAAGSERELLRVRLQISRLVDTLRVDVLNPASATLDELCFVRVTVDSHRTHDALLSAVGAYRPEIVRVDSDSLVLTVTSTPTTIDHFIQTLTPFGVIDISRTGVTTAPLAEPPLSEEALATEARTALDLLTDSKEE